MYIPVSLASGATSVDCTVPLSGDLVAACSVTYKGTTYNPGTTIPVKKGDVVRLNTTVTAYAEISVQLGGKQFYWFVDLPKTLRYISDLAFQRLTGTAYGNLTHYPSGNQVPYTETGNFTAGDAVASIDFVKKEVWFFNAAGNVRKVTLTATPVAVVFAPRWVLIEGVTTVAYIITKSQIIRLTQTFLVDVTFPITDGVVAASGDVDGNLVLAYTNSLTRWSPSTGTVLGSITNSELSALHGLYVLQDNSYITFGNGGIKRTALNGSNYVTSIVIALNGTYVGADSNKTDLYVVDGANRCVIKILLADFTYTMTYFDQVPRSVTVKDDKLYVGFFDSTTSYTMGLDFSNRTALTTTKTFGATYLADYVVTDLYTDAASVTTAEPAVSAELWQPADYAYDKAIHYDWTCTWPRAEYAKLATSPGAVVKLNGIAWTGGYLRFGDKLSIDLPATANYYYDRWVTLVGRRPVSIMLRTEPKLFPEPKSLPQINNAVPKFEYLSPAYTVEGITEGFSAHVTSNTGEEEVSFSINGGDYVFEGDIKNGDVIVVRSWLKNLRPSRNTHDTHAADNVVFSITLLPMVLNGVERRQEKTDLRNRYDGMIGNGQSTVKQDTRTPQLHHSAVVEHDWDKAEVLRNTAKLPNQTIPTALRVTTGSLKRSGNGFPESVVQQTSLTKLDWDLAATRQLQATLFSQQGMDSELARSGGKWAHIPEIEAVRNEQSHYFTMEVSFYKWEPNFYFTDAIPILLGEAPVYAFDAVWLGAIKAHTAKINAEFGRYVSRHVEKQDAAYGKNAFAHYEKIGAEYLAQTLRHVEYQNVTGVLRPSITRSFGDLIFQDYRVWHQEVIAASDWDRPAVHQFEFVSAAYGWKKDEGAQTIDAVYAWRQLPKPKPVDAVYDWNHVNEASSSPMVFERHHPTAIEVAQAVPMFAVASQDFTLPEDQSGFGAESQARAYAAEVQAQRTSFFQINGKWIFVAAPVAENALCGIVVVPPEQQKRYGYVGGG